MSAVSFQGWFPFIRNSPSPSPEPCSHRPSFNPHSAIPNPQCLLPFPFALPTHAATLDPVTLSEPTAITADSVTLAWDETTTAAGDFSSYLVVRSTQEGFSGMDALLAPSIPSVPSLGQGGMLLLALLLLFFAYRRQRRAVGLMIAAFLLASIPSSSLDVTADSADNKVAATITSKSTLSYTDTGLVSGETYFYTVTASNEVFATTLTTPMITSTPTTLTVTLPGVDESSLTLVGASESMVDASGSASVELPTEHYSFVYAVDGSDNIIGMYYGPSSEAKIDADSTAVAVVMSFPVDWLKYGFTIPDVLAAIPSDASYATLQSQVETIMATDPANLISDAHPEIWETAISIADAILATAPTPVSKRAPSKTPAEPAFIEDVSGPDVVIKNPRAVPYGISSMNIQSCNFSDYAASKTPYWVGGKDWINIVTLSETSVNYTLGVGNFVTCLSKLPADFSTRLDAVESAITSLAGTSGSASYQSLQGYFSGEALMEQVRRDAVMKGSQAWIMLAAIRAMAFIPKMGSRLE